MSYRISLQLAEAPSSSEWPGDSISREEGLRLFEALIVAKKREAFFHARMSEAKRAYEKERSRLFLLGQIDGKNEMIRNAQIEDQMSEYVDDLHERTVEWRQANLEYWVAHQHARMVEFLFGGSRQEASDESSAEESEK